MKIISVVVLASFFCSIGGYAQEKENLSFRKKLQYADFLFHSKNYYEALWKYHEFLYFNKKQPQQLKEKIKFKMGLCYFYGEKYNEALNLFFSFYRKSPNSLLAPYSFYFIGKTYESAGYYKKSLDFYSVFLKRFLSHPFSVNAKLSKTVSLLRQKKYEQASQELKKWFPENQKLLKIANKVQNPPEKYSSTLAGFYSTIVPGLGQLYLGRYKDALTAFGLTGTFAGLSIYNIYLEKHYKPRADRNYWAASFFGTIAVVFYLSNIYNAVNMANHMNRHLEISDINQFSKEIYQFKIELPILEF